MWGSDKDNSSSIWFGFRRSPTGVPLFDSVSDIDLFLDTEGFEIERGTVQTEAGSSLVKPWEARLDLVTEDHDELGVYLLSEALLRHMTGFNRQSVRVVGASKPYQEEKKDPFFCKYESGPHTTYFRWRVLHPNLCWLHFMTCYKDMEVWLEEVASRIDESAGRTDTEGVVALDFGEEFSRERAPVDELVDPNDQSYFNRVESSEE